MSVTRIASRYAKSLIDLAQEQGNVEDIVKDWNTFGEVMKNRDFELMVKSPIIKADKKQAIFKSIFDGKINPTTFAFFDIILRKGREAILPAIGREFDLQYKQMKKISEVVLTTASPLSENALNDIRARIVASGATDENVEIETKEDKNLIGGFVIEFDNQKYDSSVATKLAQLRKKFSVNEYTKTM